MLSLFARMRLVDRLQFQLENFSNYTFVKAKCLYAAVSIEENQAICVGVGDLVSQADFAAAIKPFKATSSKRKFFYPVLGDLNGAGVRDPHQYFNAGELGEQPHCWIKRVDGAAKPALINAVVVVRRNPQHELVTFGKSMIVFYATRHINASEQIIANLGPDGIAY